MGFNLCQSSVGIQNAALPKGYRRNVFIVAYLLQGGKFPLYLEVNLEERKGDISGLRNFYGRMGRCMERRIKS